MDAHEEPTVGASDAEELITGHLCLVGRLVRETMGRVPSHVSRDDLTSAGLAALVAAAHTFDATRGVTFRRYAAPRVRGALLDELRSADWATRTVRRRARELAATRARLLVVLGRTPSLAEVAGAAGLSEAEVAANDDDVARARILPLESWTTTSLDDLVADRAPSPEDLLEHGERLAGLREAIDALPARLRTVVEGTFLAERSTADLAAELGVTGSRISQLRALALRLLRQRLRARCAEV